MTNSTKYIGMDVHKESISIAVRNAAGKIVMEKCPSHRAHGAARSKQILLIHVGCEARKFQPRGNLFS